MNKRHEIDMSQGRLLPKLLAFSLPLMLTNMLQLTFNTVDLIIIGHFAGETSLAAVGSNGALVTLVICVLTGIGVGISVLTSRYFGAKDDRSLNATVGTAVIIGGVGGVVVGALGAGLAVPLLRLVGSPSDVLPLAAVYLRIYFCGLPVLMLYNFASAVLRAVGDTTRPLYYLLLAGVLHVALNLLFVIVWHMDVAGVALGTVLSQAVACVLVLRCLVKAKASYRLELRHLRFSKKQCLLLLRIGLPAGIQGSLFSLSNIAIQASVNSFGAVAMAGNSACVNIEGFLYCAQDSVSQGALTAVSQNMGARQYERTKRVVLECTLLELAISALLCYTAIAFRYGVVGLYTPDPGAIAVGTARLLINGSVYFMNGLMNMMTGVMRGHGYSFLPTAVTLLGVCAFRMIWVYTVFAWKPTLTVLFISYPISWTITALTHYITYVALRHKAFDKWEGLVVSSGIPHK